MSFQVKREKYKALEALLYNDERLTKFVVSKFLQYPSLRSLQSHCKSLELSCNGLVWLSCWLAFIYLFNREHLFEMQLNFFVGLLIDIVTIAILKSIFRRRRPTAPKDMLVLGPDKFSFPSGHASRSFYIAFFFMFLWPISKIWWMPLLSWSLSVSLSRILIQRHYILDVVGGTALGLVEACLLSIVWINENGSKAFLKYILNDDVPIDLE